MIAVITCTKVAYFFDKEKSLNFTQTDPTLQGVKDWLLNGMEFYSQQLPVWVLMAVEGYLNWDKLKVLSGAEGLRVMMSLGVIALWQMDVETFGPLRNIVAKGIYIMSLILLIHELLTAKLLKKHTPE